MKRFLEGVGDRTLYSDEPDFDQHWLSMLVDAAGVSLAVKIGDAKRLIKKSEVGKPPRHRAEADARRLASGIAGVLNSERQNGEQPK